MQQQNFYADSATVFATNSKKLEPARLVLLRRQREYLATAARTTVQIGEIHVEMIGSSYAYSATIISRAEGRLTGESQGKGRCLVRKS